VKLRAWQRDPASSPDGAAFRRAPPRRQAFAVGEEGHRGGRRGPAVEAWSAAAPRLDASKDHARAVEAVRSISAGIVEQMGFPCAVSAERTRDGIRVAVDAARGISPDRTRRGRRWRRSSTWWRGCWRPLSRDAIPRVEVDSRVTAIAASRAFEKWRVTDGGGARERYRASTEPLRDRAPHRASEVAEGEAFTSVSVGDGLFKR